MFLENLFPHPPGAGKTLRSGGRQQKQEPRRTFILIEARPQLLDAVKIGENDIEIRLERANNTGDDRCDDYNRENQPPPA